MVGGESSALRCWKFPPEEMGQRSAESGLPDFEELRRMFSSAFREAILPELEAFLCRMEANLRESQSSLRTVVCVMSDDQSSLS
ncbi:hypothetical protein Taro_036321 [Colocasia esculenta]|uniref:Uncharacterized protein n=1 Tax=Colocasia esculenta TaxID=4460 RepID=A0A843W1A6_COLES|nr:hypothetical protein [Colocasia esculenta]